MNSHEACLRLQNLFGSYTKRHYGLTGEDADDVKQEASLLLLQNFHKFDGKHLWTFAVWQLSLARNRVAHQRKLVNNRVRKHLENLARDRGNAYEPEDGLLVVENTGYVARVRESLERLSTQQREAMTRVYGLDGQPPIPAIDLGREIGISRQAVSCRLNSAVSNLRRLLGILGDE